MGCGQQEYSTEFVFVIEETIMLNKDTWNQMHKNDYHPKVSGIIARISKDLSDKANPYGHLFEEWSDILKTIISVKEKTVLEIGHGGGWYLAQCLRDGATQVVGIEVSEEINDRAQAALAHFGFNDCRLYLADESCLEKMPEKIDVIYTITVFQHTDQSITEKYLSTVKCVLNTGGRMYAQFYIKDKGQIKDPPRTVTYSYEELEAIFDRSDLVVERKGELRWNSATDWWGVFELSVK